MPNPTSLISFQYIVEDILVDDDLNNNSNHNANHVNHANNTLSYDNWIHENGHRPLAASKSCPNNRLQLTQNPSDPTQKVGGETSATPNAQNLR